MKGIILITMVLLAGCAGYKPLAELETEALASGDWSLVEQRERMIAKREQRVGPACPTGQVSVCSSYMRTDLCRCVNSKVINTLY
ncbi:MAG: hypothetical protein OEQ14_15260 [Gammaproteobacteria bacterium]|nr:hypothetical protein [Gammaproteobacteria bacterium]